MKEQILVKKPLPQNPDIWVSVPNYKEPILPVSNGYGWYGLQAYDFQGDKLMCHECGKMFGSLSEHIRKHELNPNEYRKKFGLLQKTRLESKTINDMKSRIRKDYFVNNPDIKRARIKTLISSKTTKSAANCKGIKKRLQFFNLNDSCPEQVLRRLSYLASIFGDNISVSQVLSQDSSLIPQLNYYYGTFNKAKQLLKLTKNPAEGFTQYPKQLILEDIINFYRKNKRWPTKSDYAKKLLVCSSRPVQINGGIIKLRQEAQQLKAEQDKINSIDIKGIANKIEMEYAGRARV